MYALPPSHVAGSGKPPVAFAVGFDAYASALSSITIAAFTTSWALLNGGIESLGMPVLTTAAES